MRTFVTTLILASLSACGEEAPASHDPASATGPAVRNVILISIDTLRADRLGCYGYERATSPVLDAFAARGTLFENAYATSPWTKPSHASLFSGLYPTQHGAESFGRSMSSEAPHIALHLGEYGFETFAAISNAWLATDGLEVGWDELVHETARHGSGVPTPVSDRAIEWLDARAEPERPFLMLAHYIDVHATYAAQPEYEAMFVEPYDGSVVGTDQELIGFELDLIELTPTDIAHLSRLYDAGVRQTDNEVGRLLEHIESLGLFEDTLVVIVSDHGEEFFDHDGVHHSHTQYEELVRIPFLVRGPGIAAGVRVATPVSLVDVFPSVLQSLGLDVPAGLDGQVLGERWDAAGTDAQRPIFLEASCGYPSKKKKPLKRGPLYGVRSGDFKLHYHAQHREYWLYDLSSDPAEQVDVKDAHPDVAERLVRLVEAQLAARIPPTEERVKGEELMKKIEALGYVGLDDD